MVQQGATVAVVADGQGTVPLWGGHWDFRSYDEMGKPVSDPYAWVRIAHGGALRNPATWHRRWKHLADLFNSMGIPMDLEPPALNRWTVTPLGHLRPTYLAPRWQYTAIKPEPVTFIGMPGLADFSPEALARVYEWATGIEARSLMLDAPPSWRPRWNTLNWAWYFDSQPGREWLVRVLRAHRPPSDGPLLFPQILGIEHCEALMGDLSTLLSRVVAEVPLPPPAVGGVRIQRRWDAWLRHHGVLFISGRVEQADSDGVVLADGQRVWGNVALATGGVLGGGLAVEVDGTVRDVITGVAVGNVETDDFGALGHPGWAGSVPVVGRMVKDWNPDKYGEGGAMILWTVHEAQRALTGPFITAEEGR